jgi:aspartyl-tRNA(Asn)/glutamyl-tRNA(Gln) amidotransferase subunit C
MSRVGIDDVKRVARLAHLALTEDELAQVTRNLDRLLDYVAQLQAIDVGGASETVHVGTRPTPLRADAVRPGLPREVVTATAPAAEAGLFQVPKVVESGGESAGAGTEAP